MDVKYVPSDWEKMRDGIGDLIGLGRWGKGMIDDLKDLSDNLEDAESDIAKYDSDGVISFHHTSQKSKYQGLYEDFEVLHSFTGKVGDIVDRRIDHPFYEEIDAFVETMRDATISKYTTKNRIGATETKIVYAGYGQQQSLKVPKTEVSIDDLFTGDNFYANQMKLQYDEWAKLNPDQDFSQKEYQQAVLNSHAFQYESIKDQQENKEFWGQIAALVVIVGVSLVCPPAGMALGVAYGSLELSSAVSGKDWISGRELGTGERWFRGVLAPLDIVPGVSGVSKFSSAVRVTHLGENLGALGLRTGVKAGFHQGVTHIDNMVKTAGRESVSRLKSAASKVKDVPVVVQKTSLHAPDVASPNSFKNQIGEALKEHNLTFSHFQELKLKHISELTSDEVRIMKEIRDSVTPITKETVLQKTIPASDIEKYISGDYAEIGGYVAKFDDVGHIKNYGDVVESFRLDYTSWNGTRPFPEDGNVYGKIKFTTNNVDRIEIPYGERFGGTNTDGPPCTQNGFTGSRNGELVPEWQFDNRYFPNNGAELYRVTDGIEKLVAIFDSDLKMFIPVK